MTVTDMTTIGLMSVLFVILIVLMIKDGNSPFGTRFPIDEIEDEDDEEDNNLDKK